MTEAKAELCYDESIPEQCHSPAMSVLNSALVNAQQPTRTDCVGKRHQAEIDAENSTSKPRLQATSKSDGGDVERQRSY